MDRTDPTSNPSATAPPQAAAGQLVDWLRESPDAVVQLVQRLKAASGMPQLDPAQPTDPAAAAGTRMRAGPHSATSSGHVVPSGAQEPVVDAAHATSTAQQDKTAAGAMQPCAGGTGCQPMFPQQLGVGSLPVNQQQQQQQVQVTSPSGAAAAQLKQMLASLLNKPSQQQQQQQAPQPELGKVPEQTWSGAKPPANPDPAAAHRQGPPASERDDQAQPQQAPQPQQTQLVDQLRTSLFAMLKSTAEQQQPQQDQWQSTQGQAAGVALPHMANGLAMSVGQSPAQRPAAGSTAAPVNAAGLAGLVGLDTPKDGPGMCNGSGPALSAVAARAPVAPKAEPSLSSSVDATSLVQLLSGNTAPQHGKYQQQQAAAQQQAGGAQAARQSGGSPSTPQHNSSSNANMPQLLDRLRAAVISTTQSSAGTARPAEQQQLLSIVDQLQSAWVSLGKDTAGGGAAAGQAESSAAGGVAGAGQHIGDGGPADDDDSCGLYMLLEAVQQQAQLLADGAAAGNHTTQPMAHDADMEDAAAAAAAPRDLPGHDSSGHDAFAAHGGHSAYTAAAWGDAFDDGSAGQGHYSHYPHQQQGSSRRKRNYAAERQHQQQQQAGSGGGNNLAAAVAAMMREEGITPVEAGAADPLTEQKWLLKPRARGKRQVKPNKVAFTGELPPVFDRWAGKAPRREGRGDAAAAAAAAAAGGSSEDELWRPPRVRPSKKRRLQGYGSEDGAGGLSEDVEEQQQHPGAGPGAGRVKPSSGANRRGYGWQLLQQQQQLSRQQEDEPVSSPGETTNVGVGDSAEAQEASGSESAGGAAAATAGGSAGDAYGVEEVADDGSEGPSVAAVPSAGGSTGGKARAKPAARKERWVPPTEEWTTEDGVKIWPKDTQICPAARVFYVAYKWVEEHWPNNLDTPDNHITAHPIRFYLDGQDTEMELTAKLRLYRKAVHLVISPYSALSKKFVRKWLAGYGFDPEQQVLRAYLSTLKPKPPKVLQAEDDGDGTDLTAAAAAAAEWCFGAAAQFAGGPLAADAQQQLAAQLATLASILKPKAKGSKQQEQPPGQPLQLPQMQQQLPQGVLPPLPAVLQPLAQAGQQQPQGAMQTPVQQQHGQQPQLQLQHLTAAQQVAAAAQPQHPGLALMQQLQLPVSQAAGQPLAPHQVAISSAPTQVPYSVMQQMQLMAAQQSQLLATQHAQLQAAAAAQCPPGTAQQPMQIVFVGQPVAVPVSGVPAAAPGPSSPAPAPIATQH